MTKNNETEVEEKNQQHTQGIDCTRDEGNMSNANASPSPRAVALSSSIVPVAPVAEGTISREMANGNDTQRVEESKEGEIQASGVDVGPNDSINNEPDIAGAFNSVE